MNVLQSIPRALTYRPDIDGLRAVAALAVLGIHISPWVTGGRAGVDIFFVISGFLISGIILRSLMTEGLNFIEFYSRRIRRIFPALIVVLLSTWVIASVLLLPDEYQSLGRAMVAGSLFSLNILMYLESLEPRLTADVWHHFLPHLWSLGVEEQFYIVWPPLLVVIWKASRGRVAIVAAAIGVAVISSLMIFLLFGTRPVNPVIVLPWIRLWELATGGLLACFHLPDTRRGINPVSMVDASRGPIPNLVHRRLAKDLLGILGAGLIIATLVSDPLNDPFPGAWALLPVVGTTLLIFAGPLSWVNQKVLAARPMVFLGLISYPFYLWHIPLLTVYGMSAQASPVGLMIVVLLTFILSYLTYAYIELPIRRSPGRTAVATRIFGLMMVCACIGVMTHLQWIHPRRNSDAFARAASEDWLMRFKEGSWTKYPGVLTLGEGPHRTLFWGDSALQQFYPRIDRLLAGPTSIDRGVVFATMFGCAPVVATLLNVGERYKDRCKSHTDAVRAISEDPSVDTIVIGAHWSAYLDDRAYLGVPATSEAADDALATLKQKIQAYVVSGKSVYVVLDVPSGEMFDPRSFVLRAGYFQKMDPALQQLADSAEFTKSKGRFMTRIRQLSEEAGATTIDPMDYLCTEAGCLAVSAASEAIYRDAWHLRPSYVRDHADFIDRTVSVRDIRHDVVAADTK